MSSYRARASGGDRARAAVAVVAIHALLAWLIILGLHVRKISKTDDQLTTIHISEPSSPSVFEPIPRRPKPSPPKKPQGAPSKRTEATAVVALKSAIAAQPVTASRTPAAGATSSSGSQMTGAAQGAGGEGSGVGGSGGGGSDYSKFTPARLVENIPNSAYRELASTGIPSGLVGVVILVQPSGTVSNCRIARSSGDPSVDALVCALTLRYVRFDPARDAQGRPVAQDITYFPSWRRR